MTKAEVKNAFQKWEKGPRFQGFRFGQWFLMVHFPQKRNLALYYLENDNQALRDVLRNTDYVEME